MLQSISRISGLSKDCVLPIPVPLSLQNILGSCSRPTSSARSGGKVVSKLTSCHAGQGFDVVNHVLPNQLISLWYGKGGDVVTLTMGDTEAELDWDPYTELDYVPIELLNRMDVQACASCLRGSLESNHQMLPIVMLEEEDTHWRLLRICGNKLVSNSQRPSRSFKLTGFLPFTAGPPSAQRRSSSISVSSSTLTSRRFRST